MSGAILDEALMSSVFNVSSKPDIKINGGQRAGGRRKPDNAKDAIERSVIVTLPTNGEKELSQTVEVREQDRPAEIQYKSTGQVSAEFCQKALMNLSDAQKSKLRGFIAACQGRGLELKADDERRVYFERVDGEPINEDVSDLFLWIYGFSECALLVYLATQKNYLAYNLEVIARRFECDIFTAAYLAAGIRRDVYISTCTDWDYKPEHIPPELEEPIKFKPVPPDTKFHIFEVEDKHGERFKYSISCIDEVLQDALDSLGLRVISEY